MDKYKTLKVLGQGSFGKALLVCDKRNRKRKFVVKEVVIGHLSVADKAKAEAEAEVLKQMKHSNIIAYVESFTERSNLYIVMDFADGGDLSDKIKEKKKGAGRFSEDEVMAIFVQMCLALKHIHQKNVLHRDIKSQNVFMTQTGIVKLGDFGVAKVLENTMAKAQTQIGTPFYLSPEICRGESYAVKSDIWSLGCLLYEMIAMKVPFAGSNLPALIRQITSAAPPNLKGNYSPELKNLAFDLLQKRPQARPSIKEILTMPFVKNHTKRLLSLLQKQQSSAEGAPAVAEEKTDAADSQGHKAVEEKAATEAKGENLVVKPKKANAALAKQSQIRLGQERQREQQQRRRQRGGGQDGVHAEAAKQMFWENQAAAQRNRQKHKDGNPGADFYRQGQEAKQQGGGSNPYSTRAVERERAYSREHVDDDNGDAGLDNGIDLPGSRYGGGAEGQRGRGDGGGGEDAAQRARNQQEVARQQWLEDRALAKANRERVEEDMGRYSRVGGAGGGAGEHDNDDDGADRAARVRAKAKKEQEVKRASDESAMAEAARRQAQENRDFVRRMKQRAKEEEEEDRCEQIQMDDEQAGRKQARRGQAGRGQDKKSSLHEAKGEDRERQMAEAARKQAAENKEFVRKMRQKVKEEEEEEALNSGAAEMQEQQEELLGMGGQQESLQQAALRRRKQQQQQKQLKRQHQEEERQRRRLDEEEWDERQRQSSRSQIRSQQRSPNAGKSRAARRRGGDGEHDDENDDRWREAETADMHEMLRASLTAELKEHGDEYDDEHDEDAKATLRGDADDIAAIMTQHLAAADDEYEHEGSGGQTIGTGQVGYTMALSISAPGKLAQGKMKQKSATAAPAEVARAAAAARLQELGGRSAGGWGKRVERVEAKGVSDDDDDDDDDDAVLDDLPPSQYDENSMGEYHKPVYGAHLEHQSSVEEDLAYSTDDTRTKTTGGGSKDEDDDSDLDDDYDEDPVDDDYDEDPDHDTTLPENVILSPPPQGSHHNSAVATNATSNDSIASSIAEDDYGDDGFNSDEVDEDDLDEPSDFCDDDLELSGLQVTLEEALYFSDGGGSDDEPSGRHK
jgi:NIMA (never in mitosis gene a)-related kinase